MHVEKPTTGEYATLAVMEGELTRVTVEKADAGEDLVVYVPSGVMTARAVAALRQAYPTSLIVEKGSRPGVVINAAQTTQDFAALQAATAGSEG